MGSGKPCQQWAKGEEGILLRERSCVLSQWWGWQVCSLREGLGLGALEREPLCFPVSHTAQGPLGHAKAGCAQNTAGFRFLESRGVGHGKREQWEAPLSASLPWGQPRRRPLRHDFLQSVPDTLFLILRKRFTF